MGTVAAVTAMALLAHGSRSQTALERIRARGELRVATLNLPTCYYIGPKGPTGLEYDLAKNFAHDLGVKLKIVPVPDEGALRAALASGRADIAAAQITADSAWRDVGEPAAPYAEVPQLVIYRSGEPAPQNLPQLQYAKLVVRAHSPQVEVLKQLRLVAPFLQWEATETGNTPLQDVASGEVGYAVVDGRAYAYAHHLYPDVRVAFSLPQKRPIQWVVRPDAPDLLHAVNHYFRTLRATGQLTALMQHESGNTGNFPYERSRLFQIYLVQRLPLYRKWFEAAAERYHLEWRLLAAIGFQESRWNPAAISTTGAAGVMMLTSDTAQAMGIEDRADAKANIFAGARYFKQVLEMIPKHIPEPDRTWFAIASYNVGFGHVEDARVLAQRMGKNPDSWAAVRRVLPLLTDPRWYDQAKYGYAQGWQPVEYVTRVREFLRLLEWAPESGVLVQTADANANAPVADLSGS